MLSIRRKEWATVVSQFVSELLYVPAVGVHGVNVEIAVAHGSEDDVLAIPRNRGLGVVSRRVGKLHEAGAIGIGGEDIKPGYTAHTYPLE